MMAAETDADVAAQLAATTSLYEDGILSRREYETKYAEISGGLPPTRRQRATGAEGERLLLYFLRGRACLDNEAATFFAPHEMRAAPCASSRLREALKAVDYVHARGHQRGPQPRAPWPHFPGLFRGAEKSGLFPHQLASLAAMRRQEAAAEYGAMRGGILGDAPGLGKTVTVLALVLGSAGELPKAPAAFWDAAAVDASFRALRAADAELRIEILRGLRGLVALRDAYHRKTEPWTRAEQLLKSSLPPFSFATVDALEAHVRRGVCRLWGTTPATRDDLRLDFAHAMALARCRLDGKRRSALLGAAGRRAMAERTLKASGGTLIVVPDALLDHWRAQIGRHVDLRRLAPSFGDGRSGDGCVYVHGSGDACRWHPGAPEVKPEAVRGAWLPQAATLRRYLVVVVPFSLCGAEAKRDRDWRAAKDRGVYRHGPAQDSAASALLQLRWLRLVVDEGHELAGGANAALNADASAFIAELFAERRWVVSGTPTTGDVDDLGIVAQHLKQLQRLLEWLRHPDYGTDCDPRLDDKARVQASALAKKGRWESEIARPFLRAAEAARRLTVVETGEGARQSLVDLLKGIVVRHRKDDLALPPPIYENVEVEVRAAPTEDVDTDAFQWRVDEAMAAHVVDVLGRARKAGAAPKVAVFSQRDGDLQSVAEALYQKMGGGIAEFDVKRLGARTSARELARFQSGVRLLRKCPICGAENDVDAKTCGRALLEVTIEDPGIAGGRADHYFGAQLPDVPGGPFDAAARSAFGKRVLVEPERVVLVLRAQSAPAGAQDDEAQRWAQDWRAWAPGDELVMDLSDGAGARRPSQAEWLARGSAHCLAAALAGDFETADGYLAPLLPPGETETRVRVVLRKWAKCGKWHAPRWYRGPRLEATRVAQAREDVPVLCLTRQASHGLDLSFLTHVVLLEPIRDSALLEQVVSRAHRVGATASVLVQTLQAFVTREGVDEEANAAHRPDAVFICDHCYKSFSVEAEADAHMLKCSRNPHAVDVPAWKRFTMSALFDALKPPACS